MKILDYAAGERFRKEPDIIDFKRKMVIDDCYLNYAEAQPLGPLDCLPDLKVHKRHLVTTIERYICILPDDNVKREEFVKMYEYALKNHNRLCNEYAEPNERIGFMIEHNGELNIRLL